MKFNDSTGRLGLVQDTRRLCGLSITDTSSYTIHEAATNLNAWYRKVNSWIWNATASWEYDDSNYSTLPIAVTDLVDAQQDYELPSTAQKVLRVEIKDSNGDWIKLSQIDQSEIGSAMDEYLEDNGTPQYFDIIGRSLMLYPTPDSGEVTTSGGLKLWFARDIEEFTVTDTDTEPGFNENFHRILSLGAAHDWVLGGSDPNDIYKLREFKTGIKELKEDLTSYYGARNPSKDLKINASFEGADGL